MFSDLHDSSHGQEEPAEYNEELFTSPMAGNSGIASEVLEMCISLWYEMAKEHPKIMRWVVCKSYCLKFLAKIFVSGSTFL